MAGRGMVTREGNKKRRREGVARERYACGRRTIGKAGIGETACLKAL